MKMSVTRALAEIKSLDDRIQRAVTQGEYVAVLVGKNQQAKMHSGNKSPDQVKAEIQGSFDQVQQLMSNREKLKAAVVMSNATTKVQLSSRELTVAEAIELKRSIVNKETFLNNLRVRYTQAIALVDKLNSQLDNSIQAALLTVYGNEKGKVEQTMVEAIAKPRRDREEASLFDPCDILKKIRLLEDEVIEINTELDFILSESNARTEIEVELS